ncbi:DUF1295 domain-containing protein [Thalassotalea euphylliae]|uniref:DUF1295 domain-containing protein n=1 Tax=Thalassotalea euphylliae TaxID=1655234 RepID=A0A3E0TWU8_9GAMM|nr:DUF1295 domain-containing protein [Thalassotalea euphylliae]REL28837.1 DUF1295 domain-containing protein [Thalassotalea euphylliae]
MSTRVPTRAIVMISVSLILGSLFALAGNQMSIEWQGLPAFGLCVAVAFVIQWLAFIPAYAKQTERFYDLTGSITYLSITAFILLITFEQLAERSIILAAMVIIWAARLGTFLFIRISKDGADNRFDEIKPNPLRFLAAWTIQGLWITVTASAAFVAMLSQNSHPIGWLGTIGIGLWLTGFAIEAIADHQKRIFKSTQAQTGHAFIHTGLWAYSRHPNYFGEIMLWFGVSLVALPVLSGWGYVTLISPLFVLLLLTRVSGIPLLEKSADKKYSDHELYHAYKSQTPVLVPRLTKPVLVPSVEKVKAT